MITAIIYFFFLEVEHTEITCHHTKVAALATLGVHNHSSVNLSHNVV